MEASCEDKIVKTFYRSICGFGLMFWLTNVPLCLNEAKHSKLWQSNVVCTIQNMGNRCNYIFECASACQHGENNSHVVRHKQPRKYGEYGLWMCATDDDLKQHRFEAFICIFASIIVCTNVYTTYKCTHWHFDKQSDFIVILQMILQLFGIVRVAGIQTCKQRISQPMHNQQHRSTDRQSKS